MRKPFKQYEEENPHIYLLFKKYTFEAIRRGFNHFGSKAIFEVIRYSEALKKGSDGFKVNNTYTPDYVDKFEAEFPEHKDFFEKRKRLVENR